MNTVAHIAGHTWHGRKGAVENAFRYSVDYILLDAEATTPRAPRLFGRNRAGLISLHDSDHGGAPGRGRGAAWVREVLAAHALPAPARIELLAQPRVLGHVFNPVSFWICRDEAGEVRAIIAEVTNTYGDRHSYLCHRDDLAPITASDRLHARKCFHVSPFQPVEGRYEFRFDLRPERIGIWIDLTAGNGGVLATLTGPVAPLRARGVLGALLRRPFGSRRVLALIHWQALKLWWKGARYRPRPAPPDEEVSR
ncbi:MAG: cyclopropane-fatty-acyl-phospholipid synthase [Roseovarius sp.]|nr:cyclopropane-fatty-acyl-phospholipid synthase [Roseovarius sp.]|tara:strand:+ start:144 stop:902 length:759 start_codon:yes stop_codon:yes gene_type:complete